MKKSPRHLPARTLLAVIASLCLGTSLMLSQWMPPVVPVAAEEAQEEGSGEPAPADPPETPQPPVTDTEEPARDSGQDAAAEDTAGQEPDSNEAPAVQPETPSVEEQTSEPGAAVSETALQAENDAFVLTLTPDDEQAWQKFAQAHPGVQLTIGTPQEGTLLADEGNDVLFSHDYYISFMENGAPVDASGLLFQASLQVKSTELQTLFSEEPVEGAEGSSIAVTLKLASPELQDPVTETLDLQNDTPSAMQFSLRGDGNFSLLAEIPNPGFTVQYYVNYQFLTKSISTSISKAIPVIDSSKYGYGAVNDNNGQGGELPVNGKIPKLIYLALNTTGSGTSARSTFKMTDYMAPFYSEEGYTYHQAPNPHYFNKLLLNGNYQLKEIWILKDGKNSTSTKPEDWDHYPANSKFTNNADYAASHPGVILITDGMLLRMVYDETKSDQNIPTNFYDYDISNKKNTDGSYTTSTGGNSTNTYSKANWGTAYGINSPENYSDPNAHDGKLAFGNVNTGTHLGKVRWKDASGQDNTLNMYNWKGDGYQGCTFGLASGLNGDDIQFASGITAPNLFNSEPAVGKHNYENSNLTFSRSGDTYTLKSADVMEDGVKKNTVAGLNQFSHPGKWEKIWTNHFWPMDKTPGVDGLSGGSTKVKYNGFVWNNTSVESFTGSKGQGNFPNSDDGKAHNPLFGMQYEVDFELTPDYEGPLDYFFFGDDDMWVFLDGKPVVDIGGVHSSVGQYVNLWDYIPHGDAGKHTLKFFYTERGLSGSTCYMQFTLPSVSVAQPSHNTGNLVIQKQTDSTMANPDQEYEFEIRLRDAAGNELPDEYAYTKYDAAGNPIENNIILRDKQTFTLKTGEYILCNFLPDGAVFTVEETNSGEATRVETSSGEVFYPQISPDTRPVITGTISKDTTVTYYFKNSEPKNTIDITKALTASDPGNTLPPVGADSQEFLFRILKEDGSTLLFPAGTEYTVSTVGSDAVESRTLDETGLITLKRGQTASFANSYLAASTKYLVQELFAPGTLEAYDSVKVDDEPATSVGQIEVGGTTYDAWNSGVKETGSGAETPSNTTFEWNNVLDPEKYGSLTIEKILPEGVSLNQPFVFTVSLNGEPVPDGTLYTVGEETLTFKDSQLTLLPGQKAVISNLLKGTEYEVTEAETAGFTAEITNGKGTIGLDQDVTVTALNTPDGVDVPVEKTDPSGSQLSGQAVFRLYSSMPGSGEPAKETKEFNGTTYYFEQEIKVTGKGTLPGLVPGAKYVLEETSSPSGYALLSSPVYLSVSLDKFVTLEEGSDENVSLTEDGLGLRIVNNAIPGLPDTGFTGSELIVAAGAVLLLGTAAAVLKKRSQK